MEGRECWMVYLAGGLALLLSLSLFIRLIAALDVAPAQTLEVSPPSQEVVGNPGSVVSVKAKIRNRGTASINVKVRVEDFTAAGQEGQISLVDNGAQSLTAWTVLSLDNFKLAAGEAKEVVASVTLPGGVAGGKYGAFVFSVIGDEASANSAVLSQELASLFLIKITGAVKENIEITQFSAPSFVEFGPVPFSLKFTNSGNVHLKPFGLVNVRDIFGNTVKDIVVRGETNVFPGASRVIKVFLDDKFLFGPYTAQAVINYGMMNQSLTMTTRFFVFPVRFVLIGFFVIFILYRGRKRLKKVVLALRGK